MPVLEPSDAQECKDYMVKAFDISEKYDTIVLLRSNTRISHSRGVVTIGTREEREKIPYQKNINKYVAMPAMAKQLHIVQEKRMKQIACDADHMDINRAEMKDTKIGIITSGICYQYVKEALPEASVLKMGMIYPLPAGMIRDFAAKVEKLYVIEEGNPIFEEQIRAMGIELAGGKICSPFRVSTAQI